MLKRYYAMQKFLTRQTLYLVLVALAVAALVADIKIFAVTGPSMYPAFQEGDRVLVDRYLWRLTGLYTGDVVVFDHPKGRATLDIKRVSSHPAERGTYYLVGDNAGNSADSREYGSIPPSYILGRVFLNLGK